MGWKVKEKARREGCGVKWGNDKGREVKEKGRRKEGERKERGRKADSDGRGGAANRKLCFLICSFSHKKWFG